MNPVAFTLVALFFAVGCAPANAQFKASKEEVSFMSGDLRLAGTLYVPKSAQPLPAAVLIHGSAQTDRSSLDHYAKTLAGLGVAALAYDKRGVGKSQGAEFAWREYDFDDLAADAAAGVRFLRARAEIDSGRVGIFGASQGGWVGPLAAKRAGGVRFLVLVSASVTTVAADNLFERDARLKSEGFSEGEIAEVHAMHLVDLEVSRSGSRFDEFTRLWNEHRGKRWFPRVYRGEAPAGPDHAYRRWYRTVMDFDPVPVLRELSAPGLWLFGDPELDRYSPVRESVAALDTLRRAGKDLEVHVFPGADHSLLVKGKEAPFRPVLARWLEKTVAIAPAQSR